MLSSNDHVIILMRLQAATHALLESEDILDAYDDIAASDYHEQMEEVFQTRSLIKAEIDQCLDEIDNPNNLKNCLDLKEKD